MELAIQIADVVKSMSQFVANLKITLAIRGNMVPRGVELKDQIIIGTPGTALDWSSPRLNVLNLKKIRVFVLDEADVMIDQQGHQDFCIRIVRLESYLNVFKYNYLLRVYFFF
jgi:superfamily II DNA/RNA helicase